VKNIYVPSESQEQPLDFSAGATVSDLQIRTALEEMFKAGTVRGPDADTTSVVFLPPGVNSKLGEMIGGKHFAAYHNFFHAEQGEARYVVVPFEPQVKLAGQTAARALVEAALHPHRRRVVLSRAHVFYKRASDLLIQNAGAIACVVLLIVSPALPVGEQITAIDR
jgi:hypothetical protein